MKGNIMFQADNLVRLITEDGSGEIMRVLNDDGHVCHLSVGDKLGVAEKFMDSKDLELVSDDQEIHEELKPMKDNVPNRTEQDIHDDISKMFVQVIQWLRANGCEDKIELHIEGENYKDSSLDISFRVDIGYERCIVSSNLFKSAKVALERSKENKILQPVTIPMFVED
jgi:Asp-tRNA(Asn)/Glu-tRNA(Gln) amidotransferase A subunit family amidase